MNFELHSRVQRIGGPELAPGCGYRDIVIHEMTEGEIRELRFGRAIYPLLAAIFGFIAGASFVLWQIAP
jgi:hypothetical protein